MLGFSKRKRVSRSVPAIDASRERLWDSLFAVVEGGKKLLSPENPGGCLRREETRPRTLESSYFSAVATVVNSPRRTRRSSTGVPDAEIAAVLNLLPRVDR